MALDLSRIVRQSLNLDLKRFYARGTRIFPHAAVPTRSNDDAGKAGQARETDNSPARPTLRESPKELLENAATFSEATKKPKRLEDIWSTGPYPKESNWKQSQAKFSHRPACNPQYTSVVLFPGQGTQFVGMGRELLQYPQVRDMYDLASSILGYDLLSVCLHGPKTTLNQTLFCQPAVLVTSLACVERLKATDPGALDNCVAAAGFSVGEITALVFAGSLTFENAVQLVKVRAEAMQLASEVTPSGMMTVFYGPDSELGAACNHAKAHCQTLGLENVECRVANYLYPDCKVIAGNIEALDFVQNHAADFKLRRLKRLPVSGAFHTGLMAPAMEVVQRALKKMHVRDPSVPVHSNVDGKRYRNALHIVKNLPKQIVKPVCWEQTMHILYERNKDQLFPKTYECGPGSSLRAILKMVNARAAQSCQSIEV